MKITYNLLKARESLYKDFTKDLEKSNTLWEDMIKLIIISTSAASISRYKYCRGQACLPPTKGLYGGMALWYNLTTK